MRAAALSRDRAGRRGAATRADLARTASRGDLRADGSGWLDGRGYYFTSTAYQLLAPLYILPAAAAPAHRRRPGPRRRLREHYELLKLLFLSFNSDFELAACHVPLEYNPDTKDRDELRRDELLMSSPQIYHRQGLYRGILDVVVESLIVDGSQMDVARCRSYGEFLREWEREGSEVHAVRGELQALLQGFDPSRKPVLWHVLVTQYLLYSALRQDPPLSPGTGRCRTGRFSRSTGGARTTRRRTTTFSSLFGRRSPTSRVFRRREFAAGPAKRRVNHATIGAGTRPPTQAHAGDASPRRSPRVAHRRMRPGTPRPSRAGSRRPRRLRRPGRLPA